MEPLRTIGLPEHLMVGGGVQARFVLGVIVRNRQRFGHGLGLGWRLSSWLVDRRQIEIAFQ